MEKFIYRRSLHYGFMLTPIPSNLACVVDQPIIRRVIRCIDLCGHRGNLFSCYKPFCRNIRKSEKSRRLQVEKRCQDFSPALRITKFCEPKETI